MKLSGRLETLELIPPRVERNLTPSRRPSGRGNLHSLARGGIERDRAGIAASSTVPESRWSFLVNGGGCVIVIARESGASTGPESRYLPPKAAIGVPGPLYLRPPNRCPTGIGAQQSLTRGGIDVPLVDQS